MQLFYCKNITPNSYSTLDTEESRHAVRVLRMREGDEINVTDGMGHLYSCRIVSADERACSIEATAPLQSLIANQPSLHLAVAPTKNPSRMEWLVEKAVEVGVGEITLLQCDHSERTFLKTDRLQKLAVSAMKQSLHLTQAHSCNHGEKRSCTVSLVLPLSVLEQIPRFLRRKDAALLRYGRVLGKGVLRVRAYVALLHSPPEGDSSAPDYVLHRSGGKRYDRLSVGILHTG